MARSASNAGTLNLPPEPDPNRMPVRYGSRPQLAQIHERYWGPMSPRSLERWSLKWRNCNGRAVASVREFIAEAEKRFGAAPVIRSGRSRPGGKRSV
jgi:hypothetical protein